MLYRQKIDVFIRIYNDVGYIVNKGSHKSYITDKSGAIFLKAISREPKSLVEIVSEIAESFISVNLDILKKDVVEFLHLLEKEEFLVSGNTIEELNQNDNRFSYLSNMKLMRNFYLKVYFELIETKRRLSLNILRIRLFSHKFMLNLQVDATKDAYIVTFLMRIKILISNQNFFIVC